MQQSAQDDPRHTPDALADHVTADAGTLKDQALHAANQARGAATSVATEARNRLGEIVDGQKQAGADQLATMAKAAQTAADDLKDTSPQIARYVRDTAQSVDRFAQDLRGRDVGDVVDAVTAFARQQPVAFLAGSVLAGIFLARFIKSDPRPMEHRPTVGRPDGSV